LQSSYNALKNSDDALQATWKKIELLDQLDEKEKH
jgi:hypothetical protein